VRLKFDAADSKDQDDALARQYHELGDDSPQKCAISLPREPQSVNSFFVIDEIRVAKWSTRGETLSISRFRTPIQAADRRTVLV
jgi:hypothetical protein